MMLVVIEARGGGETGIAATAISALGTPLWDRKSKLLRLPLATLFGRFRAAVPICGSGGFATYTVEELRDQLACWIQLDGLRWVKMKIGTDPDCDPQRVREPKAAIGSHLLSSMAMAPMTSSRRSCWRSALVDDAHYIDLSLNLSGACAAPRLRDLEWFHEHVRIEHMLFDGAPVAEDGDIRLDISRPGDDLAFKFQDAERFRVA